MAPGQVVKQPFPSPTSSRFLFNQAGFYRFDSLAVDNVGNVYVFTLTSGAIRVVAPDGMLVRSVRMPDVYVTNLCFGGPGLRTAFIILSGVGQLAVMEWPVPGLKLNHAA